MGSAVRSHEAPNRISATAKSGSLCPRRSHDYKRIRYFPFLLERSSKRIAYCRSVGEYQNLHLTQYPQIHVHSLSVYNNAYSGMRLLCLPRCPSGYLLGHQALGQKTLCCSCSASILPASADMYHIYRMRGKDPLRSKPPCHSSGRTVFRH